MKKFEKMKSFSSVLRFDFLGCFDFGFDDGRIDCAQFPPRLVDEKGMIFRVFGDENKCFFLCYCKIRMKKVIFAMLIAKLE